MNKIEDMLKGIDKKTLEAGKQYAAAYAKTEEGKAMMARFKNVRPEDSEAILKILRDNPDMLRSIEKLIK